VGENHAGVIVCYGGSLLMASRTENSGNEDIIYVNFGKLSYIDFVRVLVFFYNAKCKNYIIVFLRRN